VRKLLTEEANFIVIYDSCIHIFFAFILILSSLLATAPAGGTGRCRGALGAFWCVLVRLRCDCEHSMTHWIRPA